MNISRRALLSSVVLPLAGCAMRTARIRTPAAPRLARVNVSEEQVIRVVTGLRPYRPSGFVVRGEKAGEKVVITLSWGTARLLQESGLQPVIYTKDQPPNTTSNIAGGYCSPVTLYDRDRVTPQFRAQFSEASHYAHRRDQLFAGVAIAAG